MAIPVINFIKKFCTKVWFWRQNFVQMRFAQLCNFSPPKFCTKNVHVKCWWNWRQKDHLLGSIIGWNDIKWEYSDPLIFTNSPILRTRYQFFNKNCLWTTTCQQQPLSLCSKVGLWRQIGSFFQSKKINSFISSLLCLFSFYNQTVVVCKWRMKRHSI